MNKTFIFCLKHTKEYLLFTGILLYFTMMNHVHAVTITTINKSAEIIFPEDNQVFLVPEQDTIFNLRASGKGKIEYKVITDALAVTIYEIKKMLIDSFIEKFQDAVTFPANSTITRILDIPLMSFTAAIGVGNHSASIEFSLARINNQIIDSISDTHNFQVKVTEPSFIFLLGIIFIYLFNRYNKTRIPLASISLRCNQ